MLPFEWLAGGWFAAFFLAAPFTAAARVRKAGVMLACALLVLLIGLAAANSSAGVRAWLPHAYLVLGYWLPGLLVSGPSVSTPFEAWLLGSDASLRPRLPRVPALLTPVVELAYLVCYPLVPIAFSVVWTKGDAGDVGRFWMAVLISGYTCYGSLPWLVSRPPRIAAAGPPVRAHVVADANALVLARVSHQLNTFPSGHVAVSSAAAGVLLTVSLPEGIAVALVAAAIATGAASGRYHYVIDVMLGLVVAFAALSVAVVIS